MYLCRVNFDCHEEVLDFVFGTLGVQCGGSEGGVLERGAANGGYGFADYA